MNPEACRRMLRDRDTLTTGEAAIVTRWAREAGWCIALHDDIDGQLQLIELFGPEFGEAADPIGLVYRAAQGFQIDEWTGRSWQKPSLGEALALAEARL
jgi:hypothetical protein